MSASEARDQRKSWLRAAIKSSRDHAMILWHEVGEPATGPEREIVDALTELQMKIGRLP